MNLFIYIMEACLNITKLFLINKSQNYLTSIRIPGVRFCMFCQELEKCRQKLVHHWIKRIRDMVNAQVSLFSLNFDKRGRIRFYDGNIGSGEIYASVIMYSLNVRGSVKFGLKLIQLLANECVEEDVYFDKWYLITCLTTYARKYHEPKYYLFVYKRMFLYINEQLE